MKNRGPRPLPASTTSLVDRSLALTRYPWGLGGTWIPAFAGKTRRAIGVTSNLRALRPRMFPWPTSVSMPHPRHLDTYPRHPDENRGPRPFTRFDYQ